MHLKGKLSADIVGYNCKRNQTHDGRTAFLDVDVRLGLDEAESVGGDELKVIAFSTMRIMSVGEGDKAQDKVAFLLDTVKPGGNVVFEKHVILIDGDQIEEQPELLRISTVDGERRVILRLRVQVGKTVSIQFNPKQGRLGLSIAKPPEDKKPARAKKANGQAELEA